MEIRGKKLDDARVANAKRKFESASLKFRKGRKTTLTFDELLDHFANDCMSFTAIGMMVCETGVTYERVRQIYNKYFVDLFPNKRTGRRRQRICTLKRRRIAATSARDDFSDNEVLTKIAQLAKAAGCAVKRPLVGKEWKKGAFSRIFINEADYSVHVARRACRIPTGRPKCSFTLSVNVMKEVAGVILLMEVDGCESRILVIPSQDILRAYQRQKAKHLGIYPLLRKSTSKKGRSTLLEWDKYENAWPSQQSG